MSLRGRNTLLIVVSLVAIVALRFLRTDLRTSPHGWDWRSVEQGPFDEVPLLSPGQRASVRVLGSASHADALWTAEMLWSTGALNVGLGPPGEGEGSESEVWVLPAGDCALSEEVLAHVGAGGGLITWSLCGALVEGLELPGALPWEPPLSSAPPAIARLDRDWLEQPIDLPLPRRHLQWASPDPWETLVAAGAGRPVVLGRGRVVFFGFDLAGWHRLLRQGDPGLAGVDRDGIHGTKPNDLRPFPWGSPLWRSPGADIWAELLAWAAGERLRGEALSRIWPLPSPAASVLVLTSDQDFAPAGWVDALLARAEQAQGEMSVLLTWGTRQSNTDGVEGEGGELLAEAALSRGTAWGHGFGLHPNGAGLGAPQTVAHAYRLHDARLRQRLDEGPRVARNHYLQWWGYDEPVGLLADLGYWMELNYVSIEPRFRGPGFLFGGGRPMRHQREDGTMLRILSQPTQIEDDVLLSDLAYSAGLEVEEALLATDHLLDSAELHRVPVTANIHPMYVVEDDLLFMGLLARAQSRGLPIVSAERWATRSWDRLRRAVQSTEGSQADDRLTHGVPHLVWTPSSAGCAAPLRASAVGALGCLSELDVLP